MLAQESTYCVNVPGGTAEVSLNGLKAILGQVEAELYHSEIYGQMLASLKALPEDVNRQVQCVVRAVGREAIRLAMRKLLRKKPSGTVLTSDRSFATATLPAAPVSTLPPAPPPPPPPSTLEPSLISSAQVQPENVTAIASPVALSPRHERTMLYPPPTPRYVKTKSRKKLSKKELAAQAALQAREECLQELGRTIRQARQEKGWSSYHLHIKTQIPMHQIEALESGCINRLPEDIYLRGFIRQVGNALGLDGHQMAGSLPEIDSATAVLPSWQQTKSTAGPLRLNSMHIYLGYAALMAGGIAWVSHQSAPHPSGSIPIAPTSAAPAQSATPDHASTSKANQKEAATPSTRQGITAPGSIAPPEASPL